MAWSPDGKRFAWSAGRGKVKIVPMEQLKEDGWVPRLFSRTFSF